MSKLKVVIRLLPGKLTAGGVVRSYHQAIMCDDGVTKIQFKTPIYQMFVLSNVMGLVESIEEEFKAIRFGVQYDPNPPSTRKKVSTPAYVGLRDAQTHPLERSSYNLGNARVTNGGASWHLFNSGKIPKLPSNEFFLHEGTKYPSSSPWGALGCIEVVGHKSGKSEWERLEDLLKKLFKNEKGTDGKALFKDKAKTIWNLGARPNLSLRLHKVARPYNPCDSKNIKNCKGSKELKEACKE